MDVIATVWKKPYHHNRNQRMLKAGVDCFRIKCSHLSSDDIAYSLKSARKQIDQFKKPAKLLADLPEAKIRLGEFPQERKRLSQGQEYIFKLGKTSPDPSVFIPIKYKDIASRLEAGDIFYIGDGQLSFTVVKVNNENEFIAETNNAGTLILRSALTIPKIMDKLDHITPFIDEILARLPESKPEMVAFSFINSKKMLQKLIDKLSRCTNSDWQPKVIAKIESRAGVGNIDEILELADGIMVARGDLALTMPFAELGVTQKMLVQKCRDKEKYVIVATQVLYSLLDNYLPHRSDILDVTNAYLDGASAIMLCTETAHSEHPERAVKVAEEIIAAMEKSLKNNSILSKYK